MRAISKIMAIRFYSKSDRERHCVQMVRYCLLSILWLTLPAYSQNLMFDHLGTGQGMSNNSVLSIAQDRLGFMWIGTRNGLNRYDGTSFKVFRSQKADSATLTHNYINALLCDSHQTLWVGTQRGLNKYNDSTGLFERIYANTRNISTLSSNEIKCLYEDRGHNIWVGALNGLNLLTSRHKNTFRRIKLQDGEGNKITKDGIRSIMQDHAGRMWIGTTGGLVEMTQDGEVRKIFKHDANQQSSISDDNVTALHEDAKHRLWVGTLSGGLNLYDPKSNTFTHFGKNSPAKLLNDNIREITSDKDGRLWIGTIEGLVIFDPERQTSQNYQHNDQQNKSLSQNSIYRVFQDRNHSFWIGTYWGGISISHSQSIYFNVYQHSDYYPSISSNLISSFHQDSDSAFWIGTEGGGLNYFQRNPANLSQGHFRVFKNEPGNSASIGSNMPKTLFKDTDGNLWIGTHGGGLNLYDPIKKSFNQQIYRPDNPETARLEIPNILEDSQKRFWIVLDGALKVSKRHGKVLDPIPKAFSPQLQSFGPMMESSDGAVWFGSAYGLFCLDKTATELRAVDLTGFKSAEISSLLEDSKKNIWIGTDMGFGKVSGSGRRNFTESDGLANNIVFGMLEDNNGFLWISTANGLSRFNPKTLEFHNYTTGDGLPGNEFNSNAYFKTRAGELFFGGVNGFVSFTPGKERLVEYSSPIRFTEIRLFGKTVKINDETKLLATDISMTREIKLTHDQNAITFEFSLLDYVKSNQDKYEYFLEGFDKNWNSTSMNFATYTNLPPGTYTLMIKGQSNSGTWSTPAKMRIVMLPPPWRTWWAYTLYVLFAGVLTFLTTRFIYLRSLFKKETELQTSKLNFFTNISHEIRTRLFLIIGPLDELSENNAKRTDQLKLIRKNSNDLLLLVNELMDFRKAEAGHMQLHLVKGNLVSCVKDVFVSFENLFETNKLTTSFEASSETIELYFDYQQIQKVIYNLLFNAHKFTPPGGTIQITIEELRHTVEIRVIDNGKGISPENLDKLFRNYFQEDDHSSQNTGYGIGLALSQNIIELHKGSLTAKSYGSTGTEPRQTVFTTTLLKGLGHFDDDQLIGVRITEIEPKNPIAALSDHEHGDVLPTPKVHSENQLTLLLVEDNKEVRTLLADALSRNYKVVESQTGLQGWEHAIELSPDLIVSDVMMPEMNGYMLCAKLKKDPRTRHIPVILLTASGSYLSEALKLEYGADLYLSKPIHTKLLEFQIKTLFQSKGILRKN
jgi:ligand-binding sensor domain-containing protein/signal transduction histidine kinase/CheY-like chemotaxis protein